MADPSNAELRTSKDLVSESYKYFESISEIATQISIAVALVDMCGCLMKHSVSFEKQSRERQGNYFFLKNQYTKILLKK